MVIPCLAGSHLSPLGLAAMTSASPLTVMSNKILLIMGTANNYDYIEFYNNPVFKSSMY